MLVATSLGQNRRNREAPLLPCFYRKKTGTRPRKAAEFFGFRQSACSNNSGKKLATTARTAGNINQKQRSSKSVFVAYTSLSSKTSRSTKFPMGESVPQDCGDFRIDYPYLD
jgi:hypothetical protein